MAQAKRNEWELPHLRSAYQLSGDKKDLWGVKFYPYTEPGVDPVFAIVGSKYILVCRPPAGEKDTDRIEEIQLITDEEPKADNYHCTWTKDSETGSPLLCVAGANAKIKIYNIVKGTLEREIAGHGGDINSLEISPSNPQILASASTDCTIRIWSLDPAHAHQPCTAILAGGGHRENILTIQWAWHESGRYLISAGVDHIINLWTIPELPNQNTGTDKPNKIHYPNFSTSEIHGQIVDCIAFYHDLIISKAEKESIVLWSITGFSSSHPPPPPASEPTTHDLQRSTRSSFTPTPSTRIPATTNTFSPTLPAHQQFTRLFQFHNPESDIMFTRFSLFPAPDTGHAVLAMCTRSSRVMFWDLARLEEYSKLTSTDLSAKRPAWLVPFRTRARKKTTGVPRHLQRETSPTESSTSASTEMHQHQHPDQDKVTVMSEADIKKSMELWDAKYDMGDQLRELKAHREEVVKGLEFVGRQVAWSVGGEWCVVVGSASVVAVFQRWGR